MTMTMPDERARDLRFAGEILREMRLRKDIPEDLKQQGRVTLRHYPEPTELLQMIQDVDRMPGLPGPALGRIRGAHPSG